MAYTDKFKDVDDLISSLTPLIPTLPPEIQVTLAGFLSVNAVTAYELAIKGIIEDFATSKHNDFGEYVRNTLSRINGRIKTDDIKSLLKPFGRNYSINFDNALKQKEEEILRSDGYSILSCYANLITCRHIYVHESRITLTTQECINNYNAGKNVIDALFDTMK